VDITVVDNDTTARINNGAQIRAKQDIDVHALTRVEGDSFVANVGRPTGVGVNAILSMYSLRGDFDDYPTIPVSKFTGNPDDDLLVQPISDLNTLGAESIQGD